LLGEFPDEHRLLIPMRPSNRSLNLANAVSVVVYEAWRQRDFAGAATGTFEESLRPPAVRE
jgi:tRNA (cytidine/uridine-2'-O-)-methyltransferase